MERRVRRRRNRYQRWLSARIPWLGPHLRRRAVQGLTRDGSRESIRLLAEALPREENDEVRDAIRESLGRLSDPALADAVCAAWSETRAPALAALLAANGWVASTPPELTVLTALKTGQSDRLRTGGPAMVAPLLRACGDPDPTISTAAAQVLEGLEDEDAREAVCRVAVEEDHPTAWEAALTGGYVPGDEKRRALFFFLSEQWERYDVFDFDHRRLRTAYATSEGDLRGRIREKLRAAGRADFLRILTGEDLRARMGNMAAGELDLLVETLIEHQEWPTLWELVFLAPLAWSVRAVTAIAAGDWRPADGADRAVFEDLAALVALGLPASEAQVTELFPGLLRLQAASPELSQFPPAVKRAQAHVPGRINDLAFCPTRPVIAIGTGERKVVEWNYHHAERERVLDGFDHSIGHVAYTGDGTLVCAERTNRVDNLCAIYGWSAEGQRFRLGRHTGSVTGLAPVGQYHLLSSGRDADVVLWNVEQRREIRRRTARVYTQRVWRRGPYGYRYETRQRTDWARAVYPSPDHQRVALLCEQLALKTLPDLEEVPIRDGHSEGKRAMAWLGKRFLVLGLPNGDVTRFRVMWPHSVTPYAILEATVPLTHHESRVVAVEALAEREVVVSAESDGQIHFVTGEDGLMVGQVRAPMDNVTSLNVSPDGHFMAVGNAEEVLSFWDLRALGVGALLSSPLANATVTMLPAIDLLGENEDLDPLARRALEYVERALKHQFRFAVEIGEIPTIKMGEFDILVD